MSTSRQRRWARSIRNVEKYKAKYGEGPITFHAQAYDAAASSRPRRSRRLARPTTRALYIGRKALRDELSSTKGYEGISGPINCNEHGQCGAYFAVYQFTDGDPRPSAAKTGRRSSAGKVT
jgi:branched-chain amino acid transport system substrate-binding protein